MRTEKNNNSVCSDGDIEENNAVHCIISVWMVTAVWLNEGINDRNRRLIKRFRYFIGNIPLRRSSYQSRSQFRGQSEYWSIVLLQPSSHTMIKKSSEFISYHSRCRWLWSTTDCWVYEELMMRERFELTVYVIWILSFDPVMTNYFTKDLTSIAE